MDCGEGAQNKFADYGLGINREMIILITHLHGDHVNGLLGLLQTMSMSQRVRTLTMVGPAILKNWLEYTMRVFNIGLPFEVGFVPVRRGVVLKGREVVVRAAEANHSVPSWAYIVEERQRPGVFDPARAKALGIEEGRKWSVLQHGRSVTVKGRRITPREVVGPSRKGRRIGYSGDTRPSVGLTRFFEGVDLLIFDSTFSSRDARMAVEKKHSTSVEAAELANAAKVRRLALTHFSARYRRTDGLLREARAIFPETVVAADGLVLEVGEERAQ